MSLVAPSACTPHRIARWLVAGFAVTCLAACGSSSSKPVAAKPVKTTKALTKPAATEAPLSTAAGTIFTSPVQTTTFGEVQQAISHLYVTHPKLSSFTYQDLAYTPSARNAVLGVCHTGSGLATSASSIESSKVLGCAPLIFYFYSYGQKSLAPDAVDVARDIYWYAASEITGPFSAQGSIDTLLSSWGIH